MCLGIPGKIIDTYPVNDLVMGRIDYGGITKEACLTYVPEARVGDYVIVHVGFAISLLGEEEAMASLQAFKELSDFERELGLKDE